MASNTTTAAPLAGAPPAPAPAPAFAPAPAVQTFSTPWSYGSAIPYPHLPWGGGAVVSDARVGDFYDRRQCFGNIYAQPFLPWSGQPVDMRLGDNMDRRYTFGNIYRQPFAPPSLSRPVGPALGYHYADSAYRVGTLPQGSPTAPSAPGVYPKGGVRQDFYTNIYSFA